MMGRHASLALACLLALVAAACSSPSARFYTLSATAEQSPAPSKLAVAVGPISIPASIDRPQVVVTTSPNTVSIDEYNRWASPVQDNLSRVIAEDLGKALGTPRVMLFKETLNTDVEYRVQVEVRTFESAPGKYAALDAVWTVRRMKDGKNETGRTSVREPVQGDGFEEIAAAHSRAVAKMSQDIAGAIRALDRPA
jgi:uncharacterized lipoprotein YmbA